MSERSILAIELCLTFDAPLHEYVRPILAQSSQRMSYSAKWQLYDRVTRALLNRMDLWRSGCWDFFDNDARARSDFNMWVQGMLTEEGARSAPSGTPDPYRGEQHFMTVTMAWLMVRGTPSERALAAMCDIPESQLWLRDSFMRVLASVAQINYASVEASTLYVIPNMPNWALTAEDMQHPKFEYLRPIV